MTHCNTLQHTALVLSSLYSGTHWNTLTHWTHWNTLEHTATHCNALHWCHQVSPLEHTGSTATHCNALQHTSAHCNTLQHTALVSSSLYSGTHWNTLEHTGTHCTSVIKSLLWNTLEHSDTLEHTGTHWNTLQNTGTHCSGVIESLLWYHVFNLLVLPVKRTRQTGLVTRRCVALCCCSVLQCVAVCCSVLQCVAVCCSVLQCVAIHYTTLQQALIRLVRFLSEALNQDRSAFGMGTETLETTYFVMGAVPLDKVGSTGLKWT